ncbi:MAG: DUF2254 domain-containing protein [Pseudomonadota bacterium]|nr:DUF2254 domain-containing protein [Pseudomonadota bacterium]
MKAEIQFFWSRLNANYWFYPSGFAAFCAVLALVTVWLDRNGYASFVEQGGWLVDVSPQGATDILTVIAGSMIGVAATVFSITLVSVTYASSTYGPRLLTNFLEDKGNQVSLAAFIGTFVYALIVLRAVRVGGPAGAADPVGFAPQISLIVAYVLVAFCVAVLVFFLNHVPSSIRINVVLEQIGKRLMAAVEKTYPIEDERHDAREGQGGETLEAWGAGYVQMISFDSLQEVAAETESVISLRVRTGDFVHRGLPVADIKGAAPDDLCDTIKENITLGPVRTPEQDPQFLIDELVEIGLRALSPGINDPFTAITVLHWLGACISEVGRRDLRKDICDGDADDCPVIPLPDTFEHYLNRSFGSIRNAVSSSPSASVVMFDTIANAALPLKGDERRAALRHQGELLMRQVELALDGPDLERVRECFGRFQEAFDGASG